MLTGDGFERAAWLVSEAAEPAGVAVSLEELGLVPWERDAEGFERRFQSTALTGEPAPPPEGVAARPVETFEEFVAAAGVAHDAFDMAEHDRKVFEERQGEFWEWQQRYPPCDVRLKGANMVSAPVRARAGRIEGMALSFSVPRVPGSAWWACP